MTKNDFRSSWWSEYGPIQGHTRNSYWNLYKEMLMGMDYKPKEVQMDCCNTLTIQDFAKAKDMLIKANVPEPLYFSFGDCKPCIPQVCDTPAPQEHYVQGYWTTEEQGNNPMRIETNSATAVVSAIQSDESIQRDYLLKEFKRMADYNYTMEGKLRALFNIDAPKFPASSQELIDAFTKNAFTVDQSKVDMNTKYQAGKLERSYDDDDNYVGERFYGITFTSLPISDFDGWQKAREDYEALKVATKRKIIVGSPADGLAAIEALEAWMPTQNAPTTATVQ